MNQRVIKKVRCNICSAGCPIDAYVEEGTLVSVEGSRDLPGQSGGLCSKGAASRQYVYNKDRILYPMKRIGEKGSGEFERISWDEAYRMIAENLLRIKKEYGPQAAAFYAGYPKWYRPALLRLANAYGSPNYCTESSTCFQSAAMAWRSIYGNDICFPDLMHAQTVLVWSNNLYHSNVGMARPYQSLKARGAKIIAVDPRETVTTQAADIHLKLLPGTDGALALSMAQVIIEQQNYRAVMCLIALTGNYDIPGGNPSRPGPVPPCNEYGKVKRLDTIEAIGEKDFPAWFDLPCEEAQCTRIADYILKEEPYPLKAVVGFGLNHRMWPEPEHFQKALKALDFYVNVDLFFSDSSKMADLVLPAASSFERDVVLNGQGGMFFLSEKAIEPIGEAKNDIEIMIGMLRAMQLHDETLEHGYEKYMEYILEPSGVTLEELRAHPEGVKGRVIIPPAFKRYEKEGFHTPSGKVEFVSQILERYKDSHGYSGLPEYRDFREVSGMDREAYPLILNTGSRKPQLFHARTYRVPWLAGLEKATLVEIHPEDAKKYDIADGDMVRVSSPVGSICGIAAVYLNSQPGIVHVYHGNAKGEANDLIDRNYLDPISGFPGYKSYFCKIEKEKGEVKA